MLCHTEPKQINRLISKLSEFSAADVYIHVDLNHPEIREQIRGNVYILPIEKSFKIIWGGINIVKATLELIREVRESGKEYDYVWLISGQDYPIVSIPEIERRLEENKGTNYIDVVNLEEDRYDWYKKLYEISYPTWINKEDILIRAFKRFYKIITGGYNHTFRMFVKKKPFDEKLHFGSQWWTLTSEAAFELQEYSDGHPEVLAYYKNTIIPDESFFQTVFMRTPYREDRRESLTFCDMDGNHRHPKIITKDEYGKIMKESDKFCFARKFSSTSSWEY